ncbi:MAG: glycine cleavage system protein GcvH [Candidatus Pacebacteria bacterium]|nr:glycine cleavage system protein GcvH [Candidatus Paceibacterota bacterium]
MKRFSEEHLWVDVHKNEATIGITAYAAEELGEITFIELPDVGFVLTQGETLCVVESVKAASDIVAPLSGSVAAVNEKLENEPGLLNSAPEAEGWICRVEEIERQEVDGMMREEEYEAFISSDTENEDEDDAG